MINCLGFNILLSYNKESHSGSEYHFRHKFLYVDLIYPGAHCCLFDADYRELVELINGANQ